MPKEIIYTKNAPEPIGPYSQAIKISEENPHLIFTSGQIGINPETSNIIEGGIKEQTRRCLENIKAILKESGSELERVIKSTVYLKNINDFSEMNEVYAEYFSDSKPARSTVEVACLPRDVLIEIDVIAYS